MNPTIKYIIINGDYENRSDLEFEPYPVSTDRIQCIECKFVLKLKVNQTNNLLNTPWYLSKYGYICSNECKANIQIRNLLI